MDGFTKCKVCGVEFALIAINHYVARDLGKTGGLVASLGGSTEGMVYDAFDCPHCGCQNIIQERKRVFLLSSHVYDFEETDDDAETEDDAVEAPFSEV